MRDKYVTNDNLWEVEQGSILDKEFLKKFEKVDVLYSWGVLHHTGNMYQAFENVSELVKPGGRLFISIYNDQGDASRRWKWVKHKYVHSGKIIRFILSIYTMFKQWHKDFLNDFIKSGNPLKSWCSYGKNNRGMSAWHDIVDWTGGYPFEVAKPEEVFDFFKSKGYVLEKLKTCAGGIGCNEFVFIKK